MCLFRQLGHTDRLQSEIENLQKLESLAADQWRKSRKKKTPQISLSNFTRFLSPFAKPLPSGHRRTESALVPSATIDSLEKANSALTNLPPTSSSETNPSFKKGHRRAKSDTHNITTTLLLSGESDESSRPSSRLSSEVDGDNYSLTSTTSRTPSPTPTVDFEISVTVEIESGKMFFYNQLYDGDTAQ